MSRVLVTGATGFVGRHVITALQTQGHTPIAAVRKLQTPFPCEQVFVGELDGATDWSAALAQIDVVIHLAARVHIMKDYSANPYEAFLKTNTTATEHLAKQAVAHGVKRFIYLSSIKVNGEETIEGEVYRESSKPEPSDPYAISKWKAELLLEELSRKTALEVVILRPPLIYGPGVKANFYRLIDLANRAWPLPFGAIQNQRSFVYIDNLVSAIMAVLDDPRARNRTFLIADDEAWSLTQLFEFLRSSLKRSPRLMPIPLSFMKFFLEKSGLSSVAQRLFGSLKVSNEEIKSTLDWKPPVSSEEGLRQTINWYQDARD